MFRPASLLISSLFIVAVAVTPAYAQYQPDDNGGDASNGNGAARLDVRISQMEEQMRRLEGSIEQLAYQNKQLKEQLEKSNADTNYRLSAIEKGGAAPAANTGSNGSTTIINPPVSTGGDLTQQPQQPSEPEAQNPDDQLPTQQFTSPRDHYNYAFKLMNQAKYAEAGNSFFAFTHKYPHDPLIGNAYYWLGETYYVRRDYLKAADNFRQGYEAMPSGPKAGDNLLKLAMSLDAMKKDKEACVVLRQIASRFESSSSLRPRAEQEMNRIGCN